MTSIYFSMNNFSPTKMEPIGAPSPLLKQNVTESQCFAMRLTGTPRLTAALNTLAPSICKGIFLSLVSFPNWNVHQIHTYYTLHFLLCFNKTVLLYSWIKLFSEITHSIYNKKKICRNIISHVIPKCFESS